MVFCNVVEFAETIGFQLRHNPYFSRWFSAISATWDNFNNEYGHNPYFSRWFSAITKYLIFGENMKTSQSLF